MREAVALLEPMLLDTVDFVQQVGGLVGGLVMRLVVHRCVLPRLLVGARPMLLCGLCAAGGLVVGLVTLS